MRHYDVIVAGVGSMGSAACYHLARRGAQVLGLEQFDLPHHRGSHHGHSRMIRQSYSEHPDYVPLLQRAYELWDELETEAGIQGDAPERIFHRTGGLYLGPREGPIVAGALAAAQKHGLTHELLDADAVASRFSTFRTPGRFHGFYEEEAGFLVPERAVSVYAEQARTYGAEVRTGEPILEWRTNADGVWVRTASETFQAGHLVCTAGAWSGSLLRDLAVDLVVTRQVLAWFDPRGGSESFALGRFPCWFLETESPYGHYGFPMHSAGQAGLKIALHRPGEPIEPNQLADVDRAPRDTEIESLREVLRTWIPDGDGPLLAACTCLYTNSADSHFLLGPHPLHDRLTLAAGFSGHGFKFVSVMGEVLADLALAGRTQHPIGFLSPARFGG